MAKYFNWINSTKSEGQQNQSTDITVDNNFGRNERKATLEFVSKDSTRVVPCEITQAGTGTGTITASMPTYSANAQDTTIEMTGTSNSRAIKFKTGSMQAPTDWGHPINIPITAENCSIKIEEDTIQFTVDTAEIPDDPGASAKFTFSLVYNIGVNNGNGKRTGSITICDADTEENEATFNFTQAAGATTLTIQPSTLSFTAAEQSAKTINVTSNTTWTIREKAK